MKNSFEERLQQIRNESSKDIIPQIAQQEALLSFVNPTEIVDLPSRGKFYPDGHPLKNKDFIEIRQMTAKEEDILTNKSLIRKGLVINRLIESLLVDKSIPVQSLLVGDKNAIMVSARIAAYGAGYDVSVNCTDCGSKNILNIDLTQIKVRETQQIVSEATNDELLDNDQLDNGNILVKLPRTNWLVECKLMDGSDEQKILNMLEVKRRNDTNAELTVSEQLKIIVSSINGVSDKELVEKAVELMPAYDAKLLRKTYQKLIPNVSIEKRYVCSSCGDEQELEVPFTQEFFWPK